MKPHKELSIAEFSRAARKYDSNHPRVYGICRANGDGRPLYAPSAARGTA